MLWLSQFSRSMAIWTQLVVLPLVLLRETSDPVLFGVLSVCEFAPALAISPLAGALADGGSRRAALLALQVAFSLQSLTVVWLLVASPATPAILATSLAFGIITAADTPIRQALVAETVAPSVRLCAIGLHIGGYNLARVVAPISAGVSLAWGGPWAGLICTGWALVDFAALAVFVHKVRTTPVHDRRPTSGGFRDLLSRPSVGWPLALLATISFLGISYLSVLPLHAQNIGLSVGAYGALVGSIGVGTLAATVPLASMTDQNHGRVLLWGGVLLGGLLLCLALSRGAITLVFGVLVGSAASVTLGALNMAVQVSAGDLDRGRALGLFSSFHYGAASLGGLLAGITSQVVGATGAIGALGAMTAIVSVLLAPLTRKVLAADPRSAGRSDRQDG